MMKVSLARARLHLGAAVVAVVVGAAIGFQLLVVVGVTASHIRLRSEHRYPAAFAQAAREVPPGASFTATSYFARMGMRYAAYPRSPVGIRFDSSDQRIRAELKAKGVRYVVVTPPNVPAVFRGTQTWYRVVWESSDPPLRVLEVTG